MHAKRKCPNCGNMSLELILEEWVCHECEYHTHGGKKSKGSFR
jgi:ribosomal protein L37AE/L43A